MKRYPAYKDSGVAWLGEIPEHWEIQKISAIATIRKESDYPKKELLSVYLNEGVIKFSDVTAKRTNVTSTDLSNYQLVKKGDFVLNNQQAWRGSVGVSSYEGIVSPAYLVLNLSNSLTPTYSNYLFRNSNMVSQYLISSKGVGTIQRNLYWLHLKGSILPLPPLPEQKAIAHFLDRKCDQLDTAIAQKEQLIALLKERKQAIIQKAVTRGLDDNVPLKESGVEWIGEIPQHWEVGKIKQCANKISKGTTPSTEGRQILQSGKIRFLKSENIVRGLISKKPSFFIDEKTNFIMKRSSLQVNDILFVIAGASLGKVAIITNDVVPANTNQAVAFVRPNNKVYPYYLSKYLISSTVNKLTWLEAVQSAQPNLSMESLGNLPISLPPILEQKEISDYLDIQSQKIDQSIAQQDEAIEKLREYKMSLIDSCVMGKIRVSSKENVKL